MPTPLGRAIALILVRLFGTEMRDDRTGESLGRFLVLGWKGRIHLFHKGGEGAYEVYFVPQERARFTHQKLGIRRVLAPDFPRLPGRGRGGEGGSADG